MIILGKKISLCKLMVGYVLFFIISSAHGITLPLEEIPTFHTDHSSGTYSIQEDTIPLVNTPRDIHVVKKECAPLFYNTSSSSSLSWINVTPLSQTISENTFFTIQVSVSPSESIAGVQMELLFNPTLIMVDSITEGDLFQGYSNYFHPGIIDNLNGSIRNVFTVILSPGDGVSTQGTFVTIKCLSKNTNGTSPLNLSNIMIGNPSAFQVPASVTNGSVIVSAQDFHNPEISNISIDPIKDSNFVNITCAAKDNQGINTVYASIINPSGMKTNLSLNRYGDTNIYYLNLSYSNFGAYYFSLIAEDLSDNTKSSDSWIIFHFHLSQGWNLITLPLQCNYTASSLSREIGDTCDSIVEWDYLNQTYHSHPTGTFIDDFPIMPERGYFIHVWNTTNFILSGNFLESIPVSLIKGYNLIGWHKQNTITADSLIGSITGCDSVSTWNSLTGTYRTYLSNNPSDSFNIASGDGVFLLLQQDTQWQQEK